MNQRILDFGGPVPSNNSDFHHWQSALILRRGEHLSRPICDGRLRDIQPRWMVFLDLDNMYHFNKLNGHIAGDSLLKAFWDMLLRFDRRSNYVLRYGGDEFIWVSGFSLQHLRQHLKALKVGLESFPENVGQGVGLSCAYTAIESDMDIYVVEELFSKVAECAQEHAKNLGKGKILKVSPTGQPEVQDWEPVDGSA